MPPLPGVGLPGRSSQTSADDIHTRTPLRVFYYSKNFSITSPQRHQMMHSTYGDVLVGAVKNPPKIAKSSVFLLGVSPSTILWSSAPESSPSEYIIHLLRILWILNPPHLIKSSPANEIQIAGWVPFISGGLENTLAFNMINIKLNLVKLRKLRRSTPFHTHLKL